MSLWQPNSKQQTTFHILEITSLYVPTINFQKDKKFFGKTELKFESSVSLLLLRLALCRLHFFVNSRYNYPQVLTFH